MFIIYLVYYFKSNKSMNLQKSKEKHSNLSAPHTVI